MTLPTLNSSTPRALWRPVDAALMTAQWMVGLCALAAFLLFAVPASSARAEGLCGDDIDLHAQVIIESRYPHVSGFASAVSTVSSAPSAEHTLALTPAQPAPHVRAVLWFLSGMRHWFQPRSAGVLVGEFLADLTDPAVEQPIENALADTTNLADFDNEPLDGGMTCEGGQSCAPLERLLGHGLDGLAADAPPAERAPSRAVPGQQPPRRGPACSVGEPGCDLPAALLECDTSSSSIHLQWLFLPTRRVTFLAVSLLLDAPLAVAADSPIPRDHLLLGRRLSGRLDRPPRA